jgi:glycosyltransferase involved in cell wall biosynthesis
MAKVSIVTPVKAVEPIQVQWLVEMIGSVRAQQMTDWELIIVDDASEHSLAPIGKHVRDDDRIRAFSLAKQGLSGVAAARNYAVEKSTSPLILPVDADDKLPPNALNRYLWAWHNGGSASGFVYTDVHMFGVDFQRHYKAPGYDFTRLMASTLMVVGCLHRKSDWEKVGGWDDRLQGGLEDWEYWLRMGEHGVCGFLLSEQLYHYRRHAVGRLATLKLEPARWQQQYKLMRGLHQDIYNGRFPEMCCGSAASSSRRLGAGRGPAPASASKPIGANGVELTYIGGQKGSFGIKAPPSSRRYRVPGKNATFKVLPQDVDFFLRYAQGKAFKRTG